MYLQHIKVTGLRNLHSASIQFSPEINIIFGKNGSGKTSLLEAIHLLLTGRSFRSHHAEEFIHFDEQTCVLSGKVIPHFGGLEQEAPQVLLGIQKTKERSGRGGQSGQNQQSSADAESDSKSTHPSTSRSNQKTIIQINQQKCQSLADLARVLPLQLMNTETYHLLEGASRFRRAFLDWAMFHVEHSFFPIWQRYSRALKQRNAALKRLKSEGRGRSRSHSEGVANVLAWNKELVESGEPLHAFRTGFIEDFGPKFLQVLGDFWGEGNARQKETDSSSGLISTPVSISASSDPFSIQYHPGWSKEASLETALEESLPQDLARGFTTQGPHRGDLSFLFHESDVETVLSRGQQKLLISSLMLARAEWFVEKTGRQALFLLDDLNSELDADSTLWLLNRLKSLGGQVILSTIDPESIRPLLESLESSAPQYHMFHVEHGRVAPIRRANE